MLRLSGEESIEFARCPGCGALVAGGHAGCRAALLKVLAHEYADPAYAAVHPLTVDAYALQHPEDQPLRSRAFHLVRLCHVLEQGGDPAASADLPWLSAALDGEPALPPLEPPPPTRRGRLTIDDVRRANSPEEHTQVVQAWAASVWEAWQSHHEWARRLLREH